MTALTEYVYVVPPVRPVSWQEVEPTVHTSAAPPGPVRVTLYRASGN
jgi:hypothetical protein